MKRLAYWPRFAIAMGAILACGAPLPPAGPARAQAPAPVATNAAASGSLFVILYRPGENWTRGAPMEEQGLLEHFYYIRALHREGRILTAGPLGATEGLVVLRVKDRAEAEAIMAADPAVTAGKFVGSVAPFVARFAGMVE